MLNKSLLHNIVTVVTEFQSCVLQQVSEYFATFRNLNACRCGIDHISLFMFTVQYGDGCSEQVS